MRARRYVWAEPEVQELLKKFVPATEEVHTLHRDQGPAGKHFRLVSEKGHYGKNPIDWTRQGIYALAPSGEFLASINSTNGGDVERMLKEALEAWEALPRNKRLLAGKPEEARERWAHLYPEDGMVLRVYTRDLPREKKMKDWREGAWNLDYAWFRKEEMWKFAPGGAVKGVRHEVPEEIVRRLARCHFVDNVRGQTEAFPEEAVEEASLTVTVESVKGDRVTVKYEGTVKIEQRGNWAVDDTGARAQTRGFRGKLLGRGKWSVQGKKFETLEIVSVGTRWGGTRYNFRNGDLEEAPLGYVLTLAGPGPEDRMTPAAIWQYGWGE
ncbi:MAG: hypothetical protein HYY18_20870 [Planctomycetes bacterium]|nr:hypothetical protein [Planctomycetota bacterium]